jgi:hypothetical protein
MSIQTHKADISDMQGNGIPNQTTTPEPHDEHNHFCDAQHGFVPGRSCMMQLLVTMEMWTYLLDGVTQLYVIYLNFQKAFDTVPHMNLLSKLAIDAHGITK